MSESADTITIDEIAKDLGVSRTTVTRYFERGQYLEFLPRPQDPKAKWTIYRKDYESALAMKRRQLDNDYHQWDQLFTLDAIALD